MDVVIDEVVTQVRVTDRATLLDPETIARLVRAVMAAIDDKAVRDRRRASDTAIGGDGRGPAEGE